ncbi:MAG: U32 family peptidase [Clostridia bacterium]|nr:U32 family peptidase [Clostridia bacterium]
MKRKNTDNPEILAPVGTEGSLEAAVYAGADAVYFGAGACNARRNAGQFTGERLIEAVRFCHAHGVNVHVTVNTLVRDEERRDVADTLTEIAASGADAIIVQDLTVMRLAKQICPELQLHGSTQMAVHNASGVKMLEDLGFSRVVLARELSIDEIRKIRAETHAELECFIHGALCMSASGICYLSAMLGERSGNRGMCAQPCRLPFVCNGAEYALSLKDMSHIAHYDAYREIGVSSLKIEGRLKSPEYVAAAVDAVRRVRDGEPYSEQTLKDVFSRSGFTDGYYTGRRNHTMFGVRTQEDAKRAQSVLSGIRELYRGPRNDVPISMEVRVIKDRPTELIASDGTHSVSVTGDAPEIAIRTALSEESARKSLSKTGGTPFSAESIKCEIGEGLMLPSSALNALRRNALDALYEARAAAPARTIREPDLTLTGRPRNALPKLCVRFASFEQFTDEPSIAWYSLPVDTLSVHPECISDRAVGEIPILIYPDEEPHIAETLHTLKEHGLVYALAENVGAIRMAREAGLIPIGGYGLNVTNSDAIEAYREMGVCAQFVSFELSAPKVRDLRSDLPLGMIVAGRLPLMQLRSCPARTDKGCGTCEGRPVVTDRKGAMFPLICRERRYSTLLNSVPLYLCDKQLPPLDFYAVYLTIETKDEAAALIRSAIAGAPPEAPHTTGLAFRKLL